ncbi:hypothetical protein CQW23_22586 [Capsicum baccatum]|uniref:Uncharacterized protein n=1 Tax=Capsicum baccatum TaxID=33114 RepID=A0A2G2W1D8_CAPBA|nr:hypothetical protein CQW23_22586 [Capsicum baccatum]
MATSPHLTLPLFIALFFFSTPTLSRKILLKDTSIAPSPSDDALTTVSSPVEAPSTSGEITISPSPRDSSPVEAPSASEEIPISPSPRDSSGDIVPSPPAPAPERICGGHPHEGHHPPGIGHHKPYIKCHHEGHHQELDQPHVQEPALTPEVSSEVSESIDDDFSFLVL